jgi:hypothetical protein
MGADGHVKIYNLDQFEEKYGVEKTKIFTDLILDSVTYLHQFQSMWVITEYWGDNIYGRSTLNKIEDRQCAWDPPGPYELERIKESGLSDEELYDMISFLKTDCFIVEWEVWT